ncbi:LexA repressor [Rubripirellula tenax]|uniref:LexA repressor n=1 Tax=Rubripirellula tenax TaxID=2528015 RepID=A0A5C6F392_9BACT|nr:transcriptional repressor LexA [Rubripirellula tenax]TWU54970.1 LexA repressor [Rubripirellula tenax]
MKPNQPSRGQPKRGRPSQAEITKGQSRALDELSAAIDRHGIAPTMTELGDKLGITAASAHQLILQLERKGYVARQPRKARSLRVLRRPSQTIESMVSVPLIGVVKAGPAMLAEENCLGEVMVASDLAGRGSCFALQISGDSMKGADMRDGDVVIVRRQLIAENGEIVVALIDDEATVKRLEVEDGAIRLLPENRKYKPIEVQPDSDFRVLGKVIGVSHKSKV